MLATASRSPASEVLSRKQAEGGWFAEIKADGIRAVVSRDQYGTIIIWNRRQVDITHRYPDVVERLSRVDFVGVVDGEIVVLDAAGRPTFHLAHRRDAQSTLSTIRRLAVQVPATFMPFDMLEVDGRDIRLETYVSRRGYLAAVFDSQRDLWSPHSQDLDLMWDVVMDLKLEGLILKRGSSLYRAGRHPAWVKLKATKRVSVLVSGVVAGKGSRGPVGALEMCLLDPDAGRLVAVGRVGSGIRDADAGIIVSALDSGAAVVIEVEYLEVSPTGQLRTPTFKGIRHDVAPETCTIDTLER